MDWTQEIINHLNDCDSNGDVDLAFRQCFASGESADGWDRFGAEATRVLTDATGQYSLYIFADRSWYDDALQGIDKIGQYDTLEEALDRWKDEVFADYIGLVCEEPAE